MRPDSSFCGSPLYDTPERLAESGDGEDMNRLRLFFGRLALPIQSLERDYAITRLFLLRYSDVPNTFLRYRSEVQRFLNYIWLIEETTLTQVDPGLVQRYFSFRKHPPQDWIGVGMQPGFIGHNQKRKPNGDWRPFAYTSKTRPLTYRATQQSLSASRRVLHRYFTWVVAHSDLATHPLVAFYRPNLRASHVSAADRRDNAVRLSNQEWTYLLDTLKRKATHGTHERQLFIVVTLTTLMLRFTELAPCSSSPFRGDGPTFGDFVPQAGHGADHWCFRTFDAFGAPRLVPVAPTYLPFLVRWRRYLELATDLPEPGESGPLLPSNRGTSLSARQVSRHVVAALELLAERLREEGHQVDAARIESLKGHTSILRNTGARLLLQEGATLGELRQALGSRSSAYTASVHFKSNTRLYD